MYSAVKNFFLDRRNQFIFAVTFAWGILAHGMILFRTLAIHDATGGFFYDGVAFAGVSIGRWMQGVFSFVEKLLTGSLVCITEFCGFITFLSLSVMLCLLVDLFDLKQNKAYVTVLCGFAATSSAVLMIFGYIFLHLMPAYLLAVAGSYILCKSSHSAGNFFTGIILTVAGLLAYQGVFAVPVSMMILYILNKTEKENLSWPDFWRTSFYFLLCNITILILYMFGYKIALYIAGLYRPDIVPSQYANFNTLGATSILGYIKRIAKVYWFSLAMPRTNSQIFVSGARYVYLVIILVSIYLAFRELVYLYRDSKRAALQFFIMCSILPLGVNLMQVIVEQYIAHALNSVSWIVFIIFLLQRVDAVPSLPCRKNFRNGIVILLMLSNFIMAKHDSTSYVKLEICQYQAISYFNTLITRIKSTKGYKDELPVAYINEFEKDDKSFTEFPHFDRITPIFPYSFADKKIINNYAWQTFMRLWCGYDPTLFDVQGGGA